MLDNILTVVRVVAIAIIAVVLIVKLTVTGTADVNVPMFIVTVILLFAALRILRTL